VGGEDKKLTMEPLIKLTNNEMNLVDAPEPSPGSGEVKIKIKA